MKGNTVAAKRAVAPVEDYVPDPGAIVRAYPNPTDVIRAYVESEFHRQLATEHERKVALVTAEGAVVTDAASYQRVGERLVDVATHRKDVEAWFKPLKDWFYRAHRMVCDRETEVLAPLRRFESDGKENRLRLERAEERRRREEEQRLAEEARRAEQERLQREAELLEQRGEPELAAQVMEEAIAVPAPVITVASILPTTKGISSRENWKWRPIGGDTPQARARAEKLVPREYMSLDEKKLNAYAKAHGASARIPGIEFYDAGTVSVRG
jgi:molecular chaperone DnaK (HSP70)